MNISIVPSRELPGQITGRGLSSHPCQATRAFTRRPANPWMPSTYRDKRSSTCESAPIDCWRPKSTANRLACTRTRGPVIASLRPHDDHATIDKSPATASSHELGSGTAVISR